MDTIQIEGWQGRLGQGLAPRQLLATMLAAADLRVKEIAKQMNCAPSTAEKTLDRARAKLSDKDHQIRTIRGLCLVAVKRGIISPLVLALCFSLGLTAMQERPNNRPVRTAKVATVMRAYRQEVA